jgi:hypothetical protein
MYALPFKFKSLCYFILNAGYFPIFWSIYYLKKKSKKIVGNKKKKKNLKKANSGGSNLR